MSSNPSPVSIIIVCWNSFDLLAEAIRSAEPLTPESEIVIVDNASKDGSADKIAQGFPEARLIRNSKNLGFAAGVNIGIRAARHPLILLLNPDTRVIEDAIPRLCAYLDSHLEVGVVGPRVLNEDGSVQASRFRFPSLLNHALAASFLYQLFPNSPFFNRERYGGSDRDLPAPVDAVSGCCFMLRRDLVEQIGLLDESYFMYSEEVDFCFRTWKAGHEVHYAPVGEIVHLRGGSSRLARLQNFLEFRRSLLRFHFKHHGRWSAECARILLIVFLVIRIPYWAQIAIRRQSRTFGRTQLRTYIAGVRFLLEPMTRLLHEPTQR